MFAIIVELGWPVWPLVLASVLALALIIERTVALRRPRILPSGLLEDVVGLVKKQSVTPDIIGKLRSKRHAGFRAITVHKARSFAPAPPSRLVRMGEYRSSS